MSVNHSTRRRDRRLLLALVAAFTAVVSALMFPTAAHASLICTTTNTWGSDSAGGDFYVRYRSCNDARFYVDRMGYNGGGDAGLVSPVIRRYQPNWGTPLVVSWQGSAKDVSGIPGVEWDDIGRAVEKNLHPYVYFQYQTSSGWHDTPVIRLA